MNIIAGIVAVIYVTGLVMILLFTFMQMHLVVHIRRWVNKQVGVQGKVLRFPGRNDTQSYPVITVQLPVYNERYVVERLIRSVAALDWPSDKLEIQVLDDSVDDTTEIIDNICIQLRTKGLDIKHIRRKSREGYKAGSLQYGLEQAKGEFIAIFDADFVPSPDFLLKTVPCFDHPATGMVQTRWGHLNKNFSMLTRLQAMALDAHFSVEQAGRYRAGYFMNFNGTAGLWRKTCLIDAGGWEYDTLTEDLDISYRAQLKGWEFIYLGDVVTPAELPVAVSALKTQQYRWTKGSAENARKNLGSVCRSRLSLLKKMHAVSHLMNSSVFIWIFLIALTSVPLLWFKSYGFIDPVAFNYLSVFFAGLLLWIIFYETSMRTDEPDIRTRWGNMISRFPLFLAISMALSFHNTMAVLSGYLGRKSPFIRTPKFNHTGYSASWKSNIYLVKELDFSTIFECGFMIYFLFGVLSAFLLNDYGLLVFHILLFLGYAILFTRTLYEAGLKSAVA